MKVEAVVWYWTPTGMRREPGPHSQERYLQVAEAERLLGETHRLAFEAGRKAAAADAEGVVRSTPIRPG